MGMALFRCLSATAAMVLLLPVSRLHLALYFCVPGQEHRCEGIFHASHFRKNPLQFCYYKMRSFFLYTRDLWMHAFSCPQPHRDKGGHTYGRCMSWYQLSKVNQRNFATSRLGKSMRNVISPDCRSVDCLQPPR